MSVGGFCLGVALMAGNGTSGVDLELPGIDYPLTPTQLRPGRQPTALPLDASETRSAFALLGTDRLSATWFRTNIEYLVERRAIVLVVQAPTEAHVEAVRREARGLVVLPTRGGDAIAETLGILVYPVLIDPVAGEIRQ